MYVVHCTSYNNCFEIVNFAPLVKIRSKFYFSVQKRVKNGGINATFSNLSHVKGGATHYLILISWWPTLPFAGFIVMKHLKWKYLYFVNQTSRFTIIFRIKYANCLGKHYIQWVPEKIYFSSLFEKILWCFYSYIMTSSVWTL